jgi:ABC-2 type transport system permease protein
MVLIFLPQALVISALFVVLSGTAWVVPILAAAIPAALGAASGAAILVSAIGVSPGVDPRLRQGPNDANGNVSLHVWIVLVVMAVAALPTAAAVTGSAITGSAWVQGLAVLVGLANGVLAAWLLGRAAIAFLTDRMPDVFSRVRYGQVFRRGEPVGVLEQLERATLKGEQVMHDKRREERAARLQAAAPR